MDTSTKFIGLNVKSPLIVGAGPLMGHLDNLLKMEESGAGAVVVKPLFEEQFIYDIKKNQAVYAPTDHYGESYNYVEQKGDSTAVQRHIEFIAEAKRRLHIPVVASVDCYQFESWINCVRSFEDVGCDALEINISLLPYETSISVEDVERLYQNVITSLRRIVNIPIAVQVNPYLTDMAKSVLQLSWMNIGGVTLFGTPDNFDIDIANQQIASIAAGRPRKDCAETLRWTAVLSDKLRCGISAAQGVATSDDVVKLLLAGAQTVQVQDCLQQQGIDYIQKLNEGLRTWMEQQGYESIEQFRGKLAFKGNEVAQMTLRIRRMMENGV